MPSHHTRRVFQSMKPHLNEAMLFVSATKGVENETLLRMSEVIREVIAEKGWNPRIGAVSGPSFAKEVAKGDPTAITVGSKDADLAATVQREFSDHTFRIYTNDDIIGVELGGALKNVIAIAAGVSTARPRPQHHAALITRGLAEIARLAVACGGAHETLAGLAGMGDLVLTCTGGLSRNRTVGVELGKGRKLDEIIARRMHGKVAEGVLTTNAAVGLAKKMNVEMPITEQMYAILHGGKSPRESMHELMTRRGTSEVKLLTADQ